MEKWKAIPGYEGLYEASTDGRIRSVEGKETSNARYPVRHWKCRIMKQKIAKRTYGENCDARICLWKNGEEKTHLVSRLVASTWCSGYAEGLTVNHIDGNSLNNNFHNLEWVAIRDNIRHAYENNLVKNQKKCALVTSNGETMSFRSYAEASRHLGHSVGYIQSCIKHGRHAFDGNGNQYRISV